MKDKYFLTFYLIIFCTTVCPAENIDPDNIGDQYAYGENVGWLNFEPNLIDQNVGAQVSSEKITGVIWAENIGWINLSPTTYGGIFNDGAGNLSGYAWGENVGWINFDPNVPGNDSDYGVKIDSEGNFSGWAWGENIGWINFGLGSYYVKACKVNLKDLANFAAEWLLDGLGRAADLNNSGHVDLIDFSIIAGYWFDFCPACWPLK